MQAAQADLNTITSSAWDEASLYTMARVGYTYNDRYIFTGTIRRDGFSGFGANNKFGYFPSAAVAWRLSEEDFVKSRYEFIDNLKLRFSYGTSGNRTAGRYSTLAHMSTDMPFSSGPGGYVFGDGATGQLTQAVSAMANADLKWETTTALNLGLDFSVLNSRLYGNYEFYVSNTSNLLYNITIPSVNGMFSNTIPTNIGKLKNTGHEFSLTGIPVKTKDFQWSLTGNFSTNRNEVVSILGLDTDNDGKEDDLISSNIFIGEPLGVAYNYNITGMWQVSDFRQGIIPTGFTSGTYPTTPSPMPTSSSTASKPTPRSPPPTAIPSKEKPSSSEPSGTASSPTFTEEFRSCSKNHPRPGATTCELPARMSTIKLALTLKKPRPSFKTSPR